MVKVYWAMSPAPDGLLLADGTDELRNREEWRDLCGRLAAGRGLNLERVYRPANCELRADLRDPADGRRVNLSLGW